LDAASGKEIASLKIGGFPDAVLYDPGRHLAYIPTALDGRLWVIGLVGQGDNTILESVPTQQGARTGAVDLKTGRIYLPTAEYAPPTEPGKRPQPKPGFCGVWGAGLSASATTPIAIERAEPARMPSSAVWPSGAPGNACSAIRIESGSPMPQSAAAPMKASGAASAGAAASLRRAAAQVAPTMPSGLPTASASTAPQNTRRASAEPTSPASDTPAAVKAKSGSTT